MAHNRRARDQGALGQKAKEENGFEVLLMLMRLLLLPMLLIEIVIMLVPWETPSDFDGASKQFQWRVAGAPGKTFRPACQRPWRSPRGPEVTGVLMGALRA